MFIAPKVSNCRLCSPCCPLIPKQAFLDFYCTTSGRLIRVPISIVPVKDKNVLLLLKFGFYLKKSFASSYPLSYNFPHCSSFRNKATLADAKYIWLFVSIWFVKLSFLFHFAGQKTSPQSQKGKC